jgi:hypothetical protein
MILAILPEIFILVLAALVLVLTCFCPKSSVAAWLDYCRRALGIFS